MSSVTDTVLFTSSFPHLVEADEWAGSGEREDRDASIEVVVVGRPFWTGGAGEAASEEQIREVYRDRGARVLEELDGGFAVAIVDGDRRTIHVATDRFNVFPAYVGSANGRTAVGFHPDVLARRLGVETDFDLATIAQAIHMWYATFPYTYYRSIRELAPGSVHTWDEKGRHTVQPYWTPTYRGCPGTSHDVLSEQLAAALSAGVKRRVANANNPGLLLSAGADSRGLLFSGAERKPLTCYTFYDEPNAELELASRLAAAVGQRHVPLQRDREYYAGHARRSTRLIAGMWNCLDGHAIGFVERFDSEGIDLLLSGDFADLLFKGSGLNVGYKTLLGKNLPIRTLAPFSTVWRTPRGPISEALRPLVGERVREQYSSLDLERLDEEGWWQVVHRRVGTLSRTPSVGGPISLQRALPWDTVMADRAMADVYEQITSDARVNGSVWEGAIERLTPRSARRVPNNNWSAPLGASEIEKTLRFLYASAYRKVFRRDIDGTPLGAIANRGSWPSFSHYLVRSPVIEALWQPRQAEAAAVLRELLGYDPWDSSARYDIRRLGVGFGRVLTVKLWLEDRFSDDSEEG
jgi:hypothetical protein